LIKPTTSIHRLLRARCEAVAWPFAARTLVVAVLTLCPPAQAGDSIGVVLMHGKSGRPMSLRVAADALEAAGYPVDLPEMCWSRRRIYDLSYLDCLRDVDAAIERLKARGASEIVVGGQSLGGNAALAYGARHDWLFGIIAMAPAHNPLHLAKRAEIARSLARAREMIAAGNGNVPATFADFSGNRELPVQATANVYLTFFAPDGPAVIQTNAAQVRVPLLWVAGDSDPTQLGPQFGFASARNPRNRYVTVSADHLGTPAASRDAIVSWLTELAKH
jgi:esterase/lipase